ncbi:MAG: amidohydrolase family protein [Bacteroidetes bacterium]|nr:amidohydrolase family protein [Bacteroidota bacterium]
MLITAARIHNGHGWLPEGTVIEVADDGTIVALHGSDKLAAATFYDGILCPGFVNVHCHLELSHMKGAIPEHTSLIPFLQQVMMHRNNFSDEQKLFARHKAFNELLDNGVVAVGDIANGNDTLDLRELDRMHIHTFVECIGFTDQQVKERFSFSEKVYHAFAGQEPGEKMARQSIVPHAPYSVSQPMFGCINAFDNKALMAIHNEESTEEIKFYIDKTGAVNDLLNGFNIDSSFFKPSGKSSLQTYTEWFSPSHPFIFVHNTYTSREDVCFAQSRFSSVHWCLCPNANMYIENRLPDIDMLLKEAKNICIGTDSLASNHQLSIIAELHTIREQYPAIDWEILLKWATLNGAMALQMDDELGSITPGKRPGIIQIRELETMGQSSVNLVV